MVSLLVEAHANLNLPKKVCAYVSDRMFFCDIYLKAGITGATLILSDSFL